jgi:hypothetical protein
MMLTPVILAFPATSVPLGDGERVHVKPTDSSQRKQWSDGISPRLIVKAAVPVPLFTSALRPARLVENTTVLEVAGLKTSRVEPALPLIVQSPGPAV